MIQRVVSVLLGLWSLLLLLWSLNLKDPHLLPIRAFETATLIGMVLIAGLLVWRSQRGVIRTLLWVTLLATMLLTGLAEYRHSENRQRVMDADPAQAQRLGRHFVVGYQALDQVRSLAARGLIGGIFIARRNVGDKTVAQLRDEIASLQAARTAAGLPPLMVTTDQEGGIVSRLSPPLQRRPALASVVAGIDDASRINAASAYGETQGRELADIGITVNFSPVVDLKTGREPQLLDFHSLIERRAISADPQQTAAVALAYAQALERAGVLATLKHFPGLGPVAEDTHHFGARLEQPIAQLQQHDWLPFRQVASHSNALIMLAHVVLEAVDPDNPASSSAAVVNGIIRGDWQHQGLLVTDDLTMAAAYNRGLCRVTIDALNAGVDLLLIAYDHDKYYDAMACAIEAAQSGRLDADRLRQSAARLHRLSRVSR